MTGRRLRDIVSGCNLDVVSGFSSIFRTGSRGNGGRVVFTVHCLRKRTAGEGIGCACVGRKRVSGNNFLTSKAP